MRKSFVKVLALAPVMLVALTACQASLSSEKAKERAAGYDAAVLDNYASVTVKTKYTNVKATGIYESMSSYYQDGEETEEPEAAFCTQAEIEMIDAQAGEHKDDSGLTMKTTVQYYAYKKTGLKIVAKSEGKGTVSGVEMTSKQNQTIWVLDDGRLEKIEMSADASSKGEITVGAVSVDASGTLKYNAKATYTWNAK